MSCDLIRSNNYDLYQLFCGSLPYSHSIEPVLIVYSPPIWYSVEDKKKYMKLAPPLDILKKYWRDNNEADYIQAYHERVLSRLDPDEVVRELHRMTDHTDIVLLCYEKPGDFCHRHLVADWLNEHGIECLEWTGLMKGE